MPVPPLPLVPMGTTTRRVVQISTPTRDYALCALCDDGTVWALRHRQIGGDKWIPLPRIPQPDEESA